MTLEEAIKYYADIGKECTECGVGFSQLAEWLEELESLRTKELRVNAEKTAELMYANLSANLQDVLDYSLGEDYYNYGCDRYSCDRMCCEDLKAEFKHQKRLKSFYRLISILSSIVFIGSFFYIIFR